MYRTDIRFRLAGLYTIYTRVSISWFAHNSRINNYFCKLMTFEHSNELTITDNGTSLLSPCAGIHNSTLYQWRCQVMCTILLAVCIHGLTRDAVPYQAKASIQDAERERLSNEQLNFWLLYTFQQLRNLEKQNWYTRKCDTGRHLFQLHARRRWLHFSEDIACASSQYR